MPELRDRQRTDARVATVDMFTRRVGVALSNGHFAAARRVIDEAEYSTKPRNIRDMTFEEKLDLPLAEIGLHPRIVNSLDLAGIYTVRHLLAMRPRDLATIRNVGPESFRAIHRALKRLKLYPE